MQKIPIASPSLLITAVPDAPAAALATATIALGSAGEAERRRAFTPAAT